MSKRIRFFLLHLFLCLSITILLLGTVYLTWYPNPLAQAVGADKIFVLILIVDVIIGPSLGLLVYKERKKSLKFDLGIIILLQFTALVYGIYSLAEGRPVWMVYNIDRFELIKKNELFIDDVKKIESAFLHESRFGPQYAAQPSKDKKQQEDDLFAEAVGGISLAQKPERYVEFKTVKSGIKQKMLPLKQLEQFNKTVDVQEIISKYPQAKAYLPLKASMIDMTVLVNSEGDVVKIVNLRPWN